MHEKWVQIGLETDPNYPNLKCQFLEFYYMIFNSLFLQESFPLIKIKKKEGKKYFSFSFEDSLG